MELIAGLNKYSRHESGCNAEKEEAREEDQGGETGCETAERCEERGEEGKHIKGQTHEVENPAKSPHIIIVGACGMFSMLTYEGRRCAITASNPCVSERQRWYGLAAIVVAGTANVEICPLRYRTTGATDARCIRLEEIGLVEGSAACDAAENDKEDEDN